MTQKALSRRLFLATTASLVPAASIILLGCNTARGQTPARDAASDPVRGYGPTDRAPRCSPGVATDVNIEGPYYRAGAPFRSNLVDPDVVGTPLLVSGSILSLDCKTPLAGAIVDVWQANGNGQYDNDGTMHLAAQAMRLRGKLRTDARGAFTIATVLPGHYLNGPTYRPAHIHVKVSAPGHVPLTTQLYFPGDPYNAGDPFIRPSLIMDMGRANGELAASYDFTLRPLA